MAKTVKLPDVLPYCQFLDFSKHIAQFKNLFCYALRGYPRKGVAVMIYREAGDVFIRTADFNGTILEPVNNKAATTVMGEHLNRLVFTMKTIRLNQAIFYFSGENDFTLVDMRLTLEKFCGPGYLNDFFGKQGIPTQVIINQPIILTDENISMLSDGNGDYAGSVILKPSAFKFTMIGGQPTPLYGVLREIKIPS